MADPTSVSESAAVAWIASAIGTILMAFGAVLGWNYRETVKTVKGQGEAIAALQVKTGKIETEAASFVGKDEVERDFVRKVELTEMEVRVAGLASRKELIAYMREHSERQQRWEEQQQRQHEQNREHLKEIKDASLLRDKHAQEFRDEMRTAIGAVAQDMGRLAIKVAEVATTQKVKGEQGS
jgi:hypothetical protein